MQNVTESRISAFKTNHSCLNTSEYREGEEVVELAVLICQCISFLCLLISFAKEHAFLQLEPQAGMGCEATSAVVLMGYASVQCCP